MVIRPLTEPLQKVAQEELNEVPERIESELKDFRKWIAEQPHLKSRTDDQFLIAFLRCCKHNLQEAQQMLDNYYARQNAYSEILRRPNIKDEKFRNLLKCGIVVYLPQPIAENGPRVILIRNGAFNPNQYNFAEIQQFRQLLQDILFLEDDVAVVGGVIFVMDFGDVTGTHYKQTSPSALKKISQYTEDGVPINLKANYFINTASAFASLYSLVRPFLPAKTQNKMCIYGSNLEEFYKNIPQQILPEEYGGNAGKLQNLIDQWEQKTLSYVEYFQDNDQYGIDESLRVKNAESSTRSKFLGIF